jgi:hypothetical protein
MEPLTRSTTLTTRQPHHPLGDPVTHYDPYPTGRSSFGQHGAASPVPPLGTGKREGVGVGKMADYSMERQGWWWGR